MNHDPAPEVTARGWRGVLQRFARWRHFCEWEYGTCAGTVPRCRARRNRSSGEVQFVIWTKGTVVKHPAYDMRPVYVYPADWWIAFHAYWWSKFVADKSYE